MFKKKNKIEVVPESAYTDYSHRFEEESNRSEYATKETYIAAALVPTTAILGFMAFNKPTIEQTTSQMIPVSSTPFIEPVTTPISQLVQTPMVLSDATMIPVNAIGDASMNALATVLDPLLQILVGLSFPVASVVITASCFILMLGNSEKSLGLMMKTALGYCLIQLSPLLLGILRTLGDSVASQ